MNVNLYAKMTKLTMKYFYSCPELKEIKQSYFHSKMNKKIMTVTFFGLEKIAT